MKRNRGNRVMRLEGRERAEKCLARTMEMAKRLRVPFLRVGERLGDGGAGFLGGRARGKR